MIEFLIDLRHTLARACESLVQLWMARSMCQAPIDELLQMLDHEDTSSTRFNPQSRARLERVLGVWWRPLAPFGDG